MGIGTFDLHELTLCVSEGVLSKLLCIHIVGIETLNLHELIVDVFEDVLPLLLYSHIANIDVF